MIKPTKGYECLDGTLWKSVSEFQRAELVHIIKGESKPDAILDLIVKNAERVGEVFSLKERKPRGKDKAPRKALGKTFSDPQ